jgi:hypothetical protein
LHTFSRGYFSLINGVYKKAGWQAYNRGTISDSI